MNRRNFVRASTGGIAAAGIPVAVSAKSRESFSTENARRYDGFLTKVASETYLAVVDKNTGAVKVKEVEENENIGSYSVEKIKKSGRESQVTKESVKPEEISLPGQAGNTNRPEIDQMPGQTKQVVLTNDMQVGAAVEKLSAVPEIIERTEDYGRRKSGDKYCKNDCNYHWVDGTSMEFNSMVAGVSKAAIVAAVLAVIAASGSGTLAALFGNRAVEIVIGAVIGDLAGNSLSVGYYDYDLNYVVGSKKMMSGGYGLGPWKPGKSGLIEIFSWPGHGYRCYM